MARIAIGGFLHETNTFSAQLADLDAFLEADAWPGMLVGQALFDGVAGANLAIAGFVEEARCGHELLPLVWASANPSGRVTRDAFEAVWSSFHDCLDAAGAVDAVFLDLHGAMVTEHLADGEGELLRRLRDVVGGSVPLVLALDFHANVSPAMVAAADAIAIYRTYPHVDMAATGARAARLLESLLRGERLHKAFRQLNFLIPMLAQCTLVEPFSGLMRARAACERRFVVSADIAAGFPLADTYDCGPSIVVSSTNATDAEAAADWLVAEVEAVRAQFLVPLYSADDAVRQALAHCGDGPCILADTQDNPGGGGTGDTTDVLWALRRHDAHACAGLLWDPRAAARAHAAGLGATLQLSLGGQSGIGDPPFSGEFTVLALGDGEILGTGPFYGGCRMSLGPMARLRIGSIDVLVASRRQQAADQAMFRHLGVEPASQGVLVLKSSVHFRADFGAIASDIICVRASGVNFADLGSLHYKSLRPQLAESAPPHSHPGVER